MICRRHPHNHYLLAPLFSVFFSATLVAQTPTLVFPKNDYFTSPSSMVFEWNSAAGAIDYKIQVDLDPAFSLPLTIDATTASTSFASVPLTSGKYYWRVSANTGNGFNNWSQVWTFRVFSPDDLNATTWYKADFGVHLDANNRIDSITDASGNYNTALQFFNQDYRPAYVPSSEEINGQPLIQFDGENDFLDFRYYLQQIRTVFWVVREDNQASPRYRSLLGDSLIQPYFHRGCCNDANGDGYRDYPGTDKYIYDDAITRSEEYADTSVINGVTRLNGRVIDPRIVNMPTSMAIINTRTSSPARAGNFTYDWRFPNEFRVWWGDLAELIFYSAPLDTNNIKLVEEYLHHKYAPPVNLGADVVQSYRLCDTVDRRLNYYKNYTWYKNNVPLPAQANIDSIRITEPGIYSVKVTDIFGREIFDTIMVQFARPHVISDTTLCAGSSLIWNTGLTSDYDFRWQDGSSGSSFTITASGDYWVEVTDSFGCVFMTDTIHVEIDSFNLTATLGPDKAICRNQRVGLIAGANEAVSYLWNTGATTAEIAIVSSGTYSLTTSNASGCVATDDITLTVTLDAPVVNFSAPDVCLGQPAVFTNLTSATPSVTAWQWDFGDSSGDTARDPSHHYAAAGAYTVKLTATADNSCVNDFSKTVTVFNLPQAYFRDTVFCASIQRQFIDRSTEGDAPLAAWLWDFGDSAISVIQSPFHQYDSIGAYQVKLRVTDSNACMDSFAAAVAVVPGVPDAAIPGLILPKDDVTLTDTAVGFDWNPAAGAEYYTFQVATNTAFSNPLVNIDLFEDSITVSNLQFGTGFYYWRVMAVNLCGTVSYSDVQRFRLFTPAALPGNCLWLSSGYGISNDINGNVQGWNDKSPSQNNAFTLSPGFNPQYVPSVPKLNGNPVVRFDGFDDHVIFSNDIERIRTVFWVIKEDANATIKFRHLLGDTEMQPDFHRGCCSPGFPPNDTTKTIWGVYTPSWVRDGPLWMNGFPILGTSTNAPTEYSILSLRTLSDARANAFVVDRPNVVNEYRVWDGDLAELIIYCQPLTDDQIGMVESYLRTKYAPPVNLGPDIVREYGLCDPVTLRAQDHFVKYIWDVPGLTGIPDTVNSVDFYGSGTVKVTAVDIFGFVSTDEIEVIGGLQNPFKDTVFICLGSDTVWNTGLTHDYFFQWDDGSTDSFIVMNEEKLYSVTVTDAFSCSVEDAVFANIDSFSVLATLGSGDTALCEGNRIGLVTKAAEAVSYRWSTGDTVPVIAVMDSGIYSLTATNIQQCVVRDSMNVAIYGVAPLTAFIWENICIHDTTRFTDATQPPDIVRWQWDFGDGNSDSVQHPLHAYQDTGTYQVRLLAEDAEGCVQEAVQEVVIYALPSARFTHDQVNCAIDYVDFNDLSAAAGQSIASRLWTFGDGGSSTAQNPQNSYPAQGFYAVSLEVTTDKGCRQVAYDTLEIFPELQVSFRVENLCIDNRLTKFYDTSPNFSNITWFWDFGDNSAPSTAQNPGHSYIEAGKYLVSFTAENAIGCSRTIQDSINVTDPPVADFDVPDLCEDAPAVFADATVINGGDSVKTWVWEFGDGTVSSLQNPSHAYADDSAYQVRLRVVTGNGCEGSVNKTAMVVARPQAAFDFSPKFGAAPLTAAFTNQSTGAADYIWNFGDGSPASADENPSHTYQQNGEYIITLIASGLPGCSDTASQAIDVSVPLVDIGIDRIFLTRSGNGSGCLLDMTAIITNYGTTDVTSFDIQAHSSEGGRIEDHWQGSFPDNRELTFPFTVQFVLTDCDNTVICMTVMNPNGAQDQNPLNDHSCTTLSDDWIIIGPYPNPADDFVRVDFLLPSKGSLKITSYNVVGQRLSVLHDAETASGYYPLVMETGLLQAGVYFLKIEYHNKEQVLKLVVN